MKSQVNKLKLHKKQQDLKERNAKTSLAYHIQNWHIMRKKWEEFYNTHKEIPNTKTDKRLYEWYKYQNDKLQAGILTQEQINMLNNTTGWVWSNRTLAFILEKEIKELRSEKEALENIVLINSNMINTNNQKIDKLRE